MAKPTSAITYVIVEFINSGIRSNKEIATKVAQHFPGERFEHKRLVQRVANTRYLLTREQSINGMGD